MAAPARTRLRAAFRCGGLLLAGGCFGGCGGPASDAGSPGAEAAVVDGPARIVRRGAPPAFDTVGARPRAAYVVGVRNPDGTPVVGTRVTFAARNAQVAAPGGPLGSRVTLTTDSRGEVAAEIRHGGVTGTGQIIATVVTSGASDTLRVGVLPSAAFAGDPARDRAPEAGRASENAVKVPVGELVLTKGREAWLASFDGSDLRKLPFTVPSAREPSVSWSRDGLRIVLASTRGFLVFDVEDGTEWRGGRRDVDALWPRFGPDGAVHYSAPAETGGWELVRMRPARGSAPEVTISADRFPNDDFFPDWSPGGDRFVFTADWERHSQYVLRIADRSGSRIASLGVEGVTPVWSPDGSLIAYQELGAVGVVSPDGLTAREWRLGWSKGVTWSPRSDRLVGLRAGHIEVVDVETGETLALTHFGGGISAVAWRPRTRFVEVTPTVAAPPAPRRAGDGS